MTEAETAAAVCAQCGRSIDVAEPELPPEMRLCPECREDDRRGDYDVGEAD